MFGGILFRMISSRMKWQSIPTCLVFAWWTRFAARLMVDRISEWRVISSSHLIPMFGRSSLTVYVMGLYSASAEDRDTTSCFFCFLWDKWITELNKPASQRSSRCLTSTLDRSHHALSFSEVLAWSKMPWPWLFFIYRNTLKAASQWSAYGLFMN